MDGASGIGSVRRGWWLVFLLLSVGCASLQLPAIDPSGRSILLPAPNYTTVVGHDVDPVTGQRRSPLLDQLLHRNRGPAFTSPPAVPDCQVPAQLPNQAAATVPELPADPVAPRVLVPGVCEDPMLAAHNANTGCLGHSRSPSNPQAVVTLMPKQQIAAVGSEIILLGGVCGGDGYYRMREPLEWAIAEGSVGHFVEPGQAMVGRLGLRGALGGWLAEPLPELLSNNYAVGCTSKKTQVLTRGTVQTNDDVIVESGQAWIGVTSPIEGDTYVTLMAPDLDGWEQRTEQAVIHWVDGQWSLPPAAVVQGITPHTLTTQVVRRLTGSPISGWLVRYRILDATATFEDGSSQKEVMTDSEGRANVQIMPALAQGGMARVQVQVIRPARGTTDQLLVGEGTTAVTWTTSQLKIDITGPESLDLQQDGNYLIEVSNPGGLALQNVTVRAMVPNGFQLIGTAPTAQAFGSRLDWTIDSLGAGERREFRVTYRATQSGVVRHIVSALAPSSQAVEDTLTTQVTVDALYIEMWGPDPELEVPVGREINYTVTIRNRGDRPLDNVVISDRFDSGLEHVSGGSPIDWQLGPMQPGQERTVGLTFRVVAPGRQCHTLEATATGAPPAQVGRCVTGVENSNPPPRIDDNAGSPSDVDRRRSRLEVQITGPQQMIEGGEPGNFFITVRNQGDAPAVNVSLQTEYDNELEPRAADPRPVVPQRNRVEWYVSQIEPGGQESFQVRCEALYGNVSSSCVRAVVQSADGDRATDEYCIPILPADGAAGRTSPEPNDRTLPRTVPRGADPLPGSQFDTFGTSHQRDRQLEPIRQDQRGLDVTIDSRGDRWKVGDEVDYLIVIRNNRNVSDNDVVLTVELPPQLKLVTYTGPVRAAPGTLDWRTFRMTPIQTLRPGESIEFGVRCRVSRPGDLTARVEVRSMRTPTGVVRDDVTVASP
ncbi:MAG: DUF11 domain-containing protein [Planctomycetales bacterium]|nr:DUF11 domain-containing protein [Planctomycetales bacterium]